MPIEEIGNADGRDGNWTNREKVAGGIERSEKGDAEPAIRECVEDAMRRSTQKEVDSYSNLFGR